MSGCPLSAGMTHKARADSPPLQNSGQLGSLSARNLFVTSRKRPHASRVGGARLNRPAERGRANRARPSTSQSQETTSFWLRPGALPEVPPGGGATFVRIVFVTSCLRASGRPEPRHDRGRADTVRSRKQGARSGARNSKRAVRCFVLLYLTAAGPGPLAVDRNGAWLRSGDLATLEFKAQARIRSTTQPQSRRKRSEAGARCDHRSEVPWTNCCTSECST